MLRRSFRSLKRFYSLTDQSVPVFVSISTEWNSEQFQQTNNVSSSRRFFSKKSAWDSDLGATPSLDSLSLGSGDSLLDPGYIVDLAAASDAAAFAQEALNHWPLITGLQSSLHWLHSATGLPWWMTIPLMTFTFRIIVFPVMLAQIRNTYRLNNARPEVEAMMETYQKKLAQGEEPIEARRWYSDQISMIWKKHNCNPIRSMLPIVANGFLFVSFYIALQGLADIKVPSMCYEGTLWFQDLTQNDPSYGLPVLSSLILWTTVELGAADGMQGQSPEMMRRLKNGMRIMALILIPLTAKFPASVFCYWIASNFFSLGQALLLKNEQVKTLLRVPRPLERRDPVKELIGMPVLQVDGLPKKTKIIKDSVTKDPPPPTPPVQKIQVFKATRQKSRKKAKSIQAGTKEGV